jgi:hypothetical protein
MKKLLVPLFIVAIAMLMPANMIKAGDGGGVENNSKSTFGIFYENYCTMETVIGEGQKHIVCNVIPKKNGALLKFHGNYHGFAEGYPMCVIRCCPPPPVTEYVFNRVINFSETVGCLPWSKTYVHNFELISKGAAPNLKARIRVKYNVNANGMLTVEIFDIEYTCK